MYLKQEFHRRAAWVGSACIAAALLLVAPAGAAGQTSPVRFATDGGDAWTFDKLVTAEIAAGTCDEVLFRSPVGSVVAQPQGEQVLARVPLGAGENLITAECRDKGTSRGPMARQRWDVRLADLPKARIRTVASDGSMSLDGGASELAPARPAPIVSYEWQAADGNPAPLGGLPATGKRIRLPAPAADGEYRVALRVTDSAGRSDRSMAVFRVRGGKAEAVDAAREHPAWADRAVIYGVSPFFFGLHGLGDVTARLDDLAALGVTALWLSPITATTDNDFGYAVTDYFRLRSGDAAELHKLVDGAHARNMRVILDLAVNHVSDEHRYFQDAEAHQKTSPYYSYFDRDAGGRATHYFDWSNLENLNYDNPEVKRWITEAFAYWLRDFDVDGFRVDAAWGPYRRAPEFWASWRAELKRIKPDVLLIAEASAGNPYFFQNGFDAAYDWTAALGQWAWSAAFEDAAHTAGKLRAAIAASQATGQPGALVFRFLDNNDTGRRFVTRYGVPRARLAASLLLTLPGLPEIYWGDEVGAAFVPYQDGPPISWADSDRLRPWYRQLIALRASHPALRSHRIRFLDIQPQDQLLAYVRPGDTPEQDVLVLLNWGDAPLTVTLPQSVAAAGGTRLDLVSGERLQPDAAAVLLDAYGVRILSASPDAERPPEGGLSLPERE